MRLSHKIFQRATIRGIVDYLLYGNAPDEDSRTYEERLDETYLEFEKAVFQCEEERSSRLLELANAMTCEVAKPDIEAFAQDVVAIKADIERIFQSKTVSHILKLREAFPGQTIFGRSDVMQVIDIRPSRASQLLKEMMEHGIIEKVSGHGKGKYHFCL